MNIQKLVLKYENLNEISGNQLKKEIRKFKRLYDKKRQDMSLMEKTVLLSLQERLEEEIYMRYKDNIHEYKRMKELN